MRQSRFAGLPNSKTIIRRAGFGDAEHFFQAFFPARQIPQSVADGHDVEGIFGKRKLLRVALKEFWICDLRFAICFLPTRFGDFEHFFAEIQAGRFRALPRERERDVAGAAA